MKVLIACEESQTICKAFRELGHEAYSNDIVKCSGGYPKWHILEDSRAVINGGVVKLQTGDWLEIDKWDLIIAHPPCTYLTNAATHSHSLKCNPVNRINARTLNRIEAMRFFMDIVNADCEHIAIENPIGVMNTAYRKPDQIIHPYYFAEGVDDKENYWTKATCLWLKNLKPLEYEEPKPYQNKLGIKPGGKTLTWAEKNHGSTERSKTFPGIAKAIAEQWGGKEEMKK
jgi:hypothetical protein